MTTTEKTSLKGIFIWAVCVLFYFYEFLLRTLLGTFQQPIMQDLNIDSLNFALLSSTAYLLVYGLMQIPVGTILSKFGIKKAMMFASFVCAVATLGFSYSNHYYMALFFRGLMGLGSSFGFICLLAAVYDWMPYKNIAFYIGISQFFGTMGPMLAGGPLNAIAQNTTITWQSIFLVLGFVGVVLTFLIMVIVDKNKKSHGTFVVLSRPNDIAKDLLYMIKEPQVWVIAIFCAFIYFSLEYLSENECKNFLITKGFSSNFASYMITGAWFGFAIGSPLFGYISDKIKRRKPILLFSALATFISLVAIIYFPINEIEIFFSFLLFGMGVGSSGVGIVIMGEQFKSEKVTTGLGLNNGITILFVSIVSPIISYILTIIARQEPYQLGDFQGAFLVLILLPLSASLIAFFGIKETFGKSTKENIILNPNFVEQKNGV